MTQVPAMTGITERAARFAVDRTSPIPADALDIARLSFFDGLTVALAGAREPVGAAVRKLVALEGGAPQASAFGLAGRVPARAAALLNGTVAHALDYDDTHFDFVGHPTVAVLPAALAVAEQTQASGRELLEAFLTGVEVACRVGAWLGRPHYNAGFHQTATSGTFDATATAARLLGLDAAQASHALGLAATRAAGLKCQFGTMVKPFHAGMAAANGVECATLASLGLVARPDALECAGGFASTHGASPDATDLFEAEGHRFVDVQYKFHACCHGTHPALEALTALRDQSRLRCEDIEAVTLVIHPQWLPVCCIPSPRTGLELKFSLAMTAAMVLAQIDTGALGSFSDAACQDSALTALARRIAIETDASLPDTACHVSIKTRGGASLTLGLDLAEPVPYSLKTAKLRRKASALLGKERAGGLWEMAGCLDRLDASVLYPRLHDLLAAA
ncbi:MmgE/PrpD family protein (plasmid) [Cupriavidus necator N-1]|uniref:MmgE/PrpD family protein n=1 Tax=Cupriavidus necator (strain ATCC 43291 / DSM 13513 / CCUG 52238 / LMG 8453 / N-1) TaxID=1042878 RepID=F8GV28_CUPNN|nr:MmgE/PrpD family protein [Cupriavidus necator]AEI81455.1 MmgE/PrpD family protein [Cupriavidus necator N-1]MDX6007832.1 MmgE/PrpD family protein [Cupriavidus necator]